MFQNRKIILLSLLFCIFIVVLVAAALIITPMRTGDGYQYALTLEALMSHKTADIRLSDVNQLRTYINKYPQVHYSEQVLTSICNVILKNQKSYLGIYRSNNGKYYTGHFWVYPLFVAPFKLILRASGANELKAFQLANAVIILLALGYVLFLSHILIKTRIFISFSLLTSGLIYYLRWSHPELFSTALITISCISLVDKKYFIAILCAIIASWQNPPIAILLPVIFYQYLKQVITENDKNNLCMMVKSNLLSFEMLATLAISIFVLMPALFYYLNYGHTNLIVAFEGAALSNISLNRLISLFFDLNQGIILSIPAFLLSSILLLVFYGFDSFYKSLTLRKVVFNIPIIWLPMLSIIMGLGVSTTDLWNSGQTVVIRYATWISVPIIIWVALCLEKYTSWKKDLIYILIIIFQLITILYFSVLSKMEEDFIKLKPHVARLWEYLPAVYSPDPAIFGSRVSGYAYYWEHLPILYRGSDGDIRKILFRCDYNNKSIPHETICGKERKIYDKNAGKDVSNEMIEFKENNWAYLSGRLCCRYKLPLTINFSEVNDKLQLKGFSKPERWGTWTQGKQSEIFIPFEQSSKTDVSLKIKNIIAPYRSNPGLFVKIYINGVAIQEITLKNERYPEVWCVIVPYKIISRQENLWIKIEIKNPICLSELGISNDQRHLGLGVWSISLENIPQHSENKNIMK